MMRKLKYYVVLAVGVFISVNSLNAQSINDLRINEVMLFNTNNYTDNFGQRGAWIEIMNMGYNSVNLANCYLTNDLNEPKKYKIPSGDPISIIPLRQFIVFFADNKTEHGTLHLNFTLDSTHRFIALVSSNGSTIIDSVTVPVLAANQVYSRMPDGSSNWEVSNFTTPKATNEGRIEKTSAGEKFLKYDPIGAVMAIIAMMVVFTALIVLYRIFRTIGKANQKAVQRKTAKSNEGKIEPQVEEEVAGEVFAAISAALYMYETEKHDQESAIITIQRVSKIYSPWSSKIYGLRQLPNRTIVHQPKK